MLYVFEDNEAVIEMIIKGRSPTMRQVSRTHRGALDWLCDTINLDPKIRIRYIDTKHIATHIPYFGSCLLHGQGNLWKTTWRSYGRFGREIRYLVNVHEYHSSSSGSSRTRL